MLPNLEHPPPTATEVASPELVLVDENLGARARAGLSEPDDTLFRLERDIAFRRLTVRTSTFDNVAGTPEQRRHVPVVATGRSAWQQRRMLSVAVGIAATFAGALLLGVQVTLRGTPAGADSLEAVSPTTSSAIETIESRPSTQPARASSPRPPVAPERSRRQRTPSAPRNVPAPAPRRFAWAPVSGATSYRVQLFHDDDLIYSAQVPGPHLELAPRWRFRGSVHRLAAGTYRWYVWPVRSGRRDSQATVQAELSVR
jgi:hypothetical protein